MFEVVSLCAVWTQLTILGESPPFHLLGVRSDNWVDFSVFSVLSGAGV